jgi:hypothetical protein
MSKDSTTYRACVADRTLDLSLSSQTPGKPPSKYRVFPQPASAALSLQESSRSSSHTINDQNKRLARRALHLMGIWLGRIERPGARRAIEGERWEVGAQE